MYIYEIATGEQYEDPWNCILLKDTQEALVDLYIEFSQLNPLKDDYEHVKAFIKWLVEIKGFKNLKDTNQDGNILYIGSKGKYELLKRIN